MGKKFDADAFYIHLNVRYKNMKFIFEKQIKHTTNSRFSYRNIHMASFKL